jgi:hypothetical protein
MARAAWYRAGDILVYTASEQNARPLGDALNKLMLNSTNQFISHAIKTYITRHEIRWQNKTRIEWAAGLLTASIRRFFESS